MMNDNMLEMKKFNSRDWTIDETGMFADNKYTGERILLSRFIEPARNGIVFSNTGGTMQGTGFTIHSQTVT